MIFLLIYIETFINEIDLYISENYINGTFDSCKNVQFPSTGQLALDLMCGHWGAAKCSAKRWFNSMGDVNNDYVPFQINYVIESIKGVTSLDPKIVPCNKSADVSECLLREILLFLTPISI